MDHAALPQARADEIARWLTEGRVGVCLPFLLEAGYSARNAIDHQEVLDELLSLPVITIGSQVERRALDAQEQLARAGRHRLPPVDLLIAAIADVHRLGVLHYDSDYDTITEKTDLDFDSVWLARRGDL